MDILSICYRGKIICKLAVKVMQDQGKKSFLIYERSLRNMMRLSSKHVTGPRSRNHRRDITAVLRTGSLVNSLSLGKNNFSTHRKRLKTDMEGIENPSVLGRSDIMSGKEILQLYQ